jgi:hypothetical protein
MRRPVRRPNTSLRRGGAGYRAAAALILRPPRDAADLPGEHLILRSPDAGLNTYRDRIDSRVREMVRNDGWGPADWPEPADGCSIAF